MLPGLAEGQQLTGLAQPRDIAAFYLEQGAELVVLKLGPKGAYFRTADREGTIPAVPVAHVVDTVGAGDGFAVGVVSALLEGASIAMTPSLEVTVSAPSPSRWRATWMACPPGRNWTPWSSPNSPDGTGGNNRESPWVVYKNYPTNCWPHCAPASG